MEALVIAEAGVNHNGDLQLAKKLVMLLAMLALMVKFQTFKSNQLVTDYAKQASYQKGSNSTEQLAMLKRLELQPSHHVELIEYCQTKDIEFLSAAFNSSSIGLLASLGSSVEGSFW